jgi:hypothetical protein
MILQSFVGRGRFVEIQQPGWLVWIGLEVLRSHVGGGVLDVVLLLISVVDIGCDVVEEVCKCGPALVLLKRSTRGRKTFM